MTSEGTANPGKQHLLHVDKGKRHGGSRMYLNSSNCFRKVHQEVAEPQRSGKSSRTLHSCSVHVRGRLKESPRNRESPETKSPEDPLSEPWYLELGG